jgi:hypothetical protein
MGLTKALLSSCALGEAKIGNLDKVRTNDAATFYAALGNLARTCSRRPVTYLICRRSSGQFGSSKSKPG